MQKFGKFNSQEELIRGYEQLERAFTQKCQQLAQVQAQLELQTNSTVVDNGTPPATSATTANIEQNAAGSAVNELSVDCDSTSSNIGGVASLPSTGTSTQPPAEHDVSTVPQVTESSSWRNVGSQAQLLQAMQQFLAENPHLRGQLLQGTPTSQAPNLMSGGGDVSLALPNKPRTVKEASELARHLFE